MVLALLLAGRAAIIPAAPVPPSTGELADVGSLIARVDSEWPHRDAPGRLADIRAILDRAEALAPHDFGVLWREARLFFWLADDPAVPKEERSRLGEKAWKLGDRAAAADPARVEGWYYAAVGMGNYALGIGVLKALGQGIEGKFKERLSRAQRIEPNFEAGAIDTAWGRFYYELPWPKYDARDSERSLQKAIQANPANVRARVFLAELYRKEGHPKEARALLEEAAAHAPGSYDAPEERRASALAKGLLAEMDR